MNNLRFATLLHILVIALKSKNTKDLACKTQIISSEFIAGSINVNPVVVRKEIKVLKEANLIASKKGKDGGCYLIKDAKSIYLSDILALALADTNFGKMNQTNPNCCIGKQINSELVKIYNKIEQAMIDSLKSISLDEFSNQFNNIEE